MGAVIRCDGSAIKRIRTERGLTQSQLAEMVGTSKGVVQHWERGIARPSDRFRTKLIAALQCTAEDIWTPPIRYWLRGYDEEKIAKAGDAVPLLRRRLELGMTQKELAKRAGVGDGTLRAIESGRHAPTWETRQKLRRALGMPEERYFTIEERNEKLLQMENIIQWVVNSHYATIQRLGMDRSDVFQELAVCAIRALDRWYVRENGATLETYVIRNLMGRMKHLIHQHNAGGLVGGAAKNSNGPLTISLDWLMEVGVQKASGEEVS